MKAKLAVAALLAAALSTPTMAAVVVLPVATGFQETTGLSQNSGAPGDDGIYVAQKAGLLERYDRSSGVTSTVVDLRGSLVTSGEHGLIGLAFDPDYATNGRYYVHINTQPDANGPIYSEVRRFTSEAQVGQSEAPATVFRTPQTGTPNHKGGWIGFDQTGALMISLGDGGEGYDSFHTGQDPSDHLGSILRIDPSQDAFPDDPNRNYAIPAGNLDVPGAAPEVYAYGLRNPFANSIAPDGNLIVADVGQDLEEELDIIAPGAANRNLGWSLREGDAQTPFVGGPEPADYLAPSFTYDHSNGDRAIIGGFVYRGTEVPELFGRYVFGDQQSGRLWSIAYDGTDFLDETWTLIGNVFSLSSFGETAEGEILIGQYTFDDRGSVFQLASDGVPEPSSWALMLLGFGAIGGAMRRRLGFSASAAR